MLAPAIDTLPGWRTVTDLSTAIGTIPLVALGPAGAFVIETLDVTDVRTLADVPERSLIHAWAQAKHLERRRLGGEVGAVLAITGADAGAPMGRRRGVQILPVGMVTRWLSARPSLLSPREATVLGDRLDKAPLTLVIAA